MAHKYNFKALLGLHDSKVCDKYMFLIYAITEVTAGHPQPLPLWFSFSKHIRLILRKTSYNSRLTDILQNT